MIPRQARMRTHRRCAPAIAVVATGHSRGLIARAMCRVAPMHRGAAMDSRCAVTRALQPGPIRAATQATVRRRATMTPQHRELPVLTGVVRGPIVLRRSGRRISLSHERIGRLRSISRKGTRRRHRNSGRRHRPRRPGLRRNRGRHRHRRLPAPRHNRVHPRRRLARSLPASAQALRCVRRDRLQPRGPRAQRHVLLPRLGPRAPRHVRAHAHREPKRARPPRRPNSWNSTRGSESSRKKAKGKRKKAKVKKQLAKDDTKASA